MGELLEICIFLPPCANTFAQQRRPALRHRSVRVAMNLCPSPCPSQPAEVRRVVSFGLDFGINSVRLTSPSPGSLQLCPDRHLCLHQWHPHTDKVPRTDSLHL